MSDSTYVQNLKKLQEIRELAGRELNLPQICVIGDQSSGKSSLLESITGIKFPVKGGICTKAPIVVECKRDESFSNDIYEIKAPNEISYTMCKLNDLARKITKIQEACLLSLKKGISPTRIRITKSQDPIRNKLVNSSDDENPYDEEIVDASESSNNEDADEEGTDLEDTDDSIHPNPNKNNRTNESAVICEQEIRVRVIGPDQIDVVVIDLPGIINRVKGKKETRRLICNYIEPPQTLILLVSVCAQDEQLASAIDLAKKYDPLGLRTLRILTKFDYLANESLSNVEACVNLIRGTDHDLSDDQATHEQEERLLNASRYTHSSTLFPHAVACRIKATESYDTEKEREILAKYNLPPERSGIPSLKKRLPPIYAALIRTNLPGLKASMNDKLEKARTELRRIGERPVNSMAMIMECRRVLVDDMDDFKIALSVPHQKLAERIHCTQSNITESWTNEKLRPNAYDCPFFQGNSAFLSCLKEIVQWWAPLVDDYRKEVKKIVEDSLQVLKHKANGVSRNLINTIDLEWRHFVVDMFKTFGIKCNEALKKEMDFGTDNHYLNAKFYEEQLLPKGMMDEIIESVTKNCTTRGEHITTETLQKKLAPEIQKISESWALKFRAETLHEQQQRRLYAAVVAVWSVKKKTFIDMILKETRDYILKKRREWFEVAMILSVAIKNSAKEDASIQQKRILLTAKIKRLAKCKDILVIF